jgi:hypothetical protein
MIEIRILLLVIVFAFCESCFVRNAKVDEVAEHPRSESNAKTGDGPADTTSIRLHLTALTKTQSFRTHNNVAQLNQTADYIRSKFALYTNVISIQEYSAGGQSYRNIIASFGTNNSKRIIIGAHYDVCGQQEGADDNASGITGILELARMLKGKALKYRVDLVAYSLEEPPYFRTKSMGSYIHAKSLADEGASVYGMISLEMIGYFSDEPGSQTYPDGVQSGLFGDKGDYIALVARTGGGPFQKAFCSAFKQVGSIKSNQYMGPASMPGIDFSDHMNYWKFNFDAIMITDTSFYRNKNYHSSTDTIDTLDLIRMAKVIDGIYEALLIIPN